MDNEHGGTRAGAGRKTKAEKFARPIATAEKRIADRLPELIDKAFELAHGVTVEHENVITGEVNVYQRPPDRKAIEYLVNRIMGKPTERQEVEHSGPDGGPIPVDLAVRDRRLAALVELAHERATSSPPSSTE